MGVVKATVDRHMGKGTARTPNARGERARPKQLQAAVSRLRHKSLWISGHGTELPVFGRPQKKKEKKKGKLIFGKWHNQVSVATCDGGKR